MTALRIPDGVPRLSRGRHRSPRRGACFMEFASYLAGERWSDHPACTDPALAMLARMVNDLADDARRDELAIEVPRVVGLRGDDAELGLAVAVRAASAALPIASMERQRALAAGLLAAADDDRPLPSAIAAARDAALDAAPDARDWARTQRALLPTTSRGGPGIEAMVRVAAIGIREACVTDADDRLIALLRQAIADTERALGATGDDYSSAVMVHTPSASSSV